MIFDLSTPAAPLMPQPKIRCNWLFCHLLAQKAMSPANMTIANPSQNNRETLFNYDKQFFADSEDLFAFNQWVIGYPGFIDNYEYRGIKTEDYSKWISSSYQRNKGIERFNPELTDNPERVRQLVEYSITNKKIRCHKALSLGLWRTDRRALCYKHGYARLL